MTIIADRLFYHYRTSVTTPQPETPPSPSPTTTPMSTPPSKTKVSFKEGVEAILIPDRDRLKELNLMKDLYWSEKDYRQFEQNAIADLKAALKNLNT